MKDSTKAAAVEARILKDYPNGILARDQEIWRIFRIMDADAKAPELDAFLKRFPTEKFQDIETETSSMYLGKIFQAVVYQPIIKKNDYSLLYKYIHDVPHLYLLTFYWHMVQVPLNTNQRTPEQVLPFAKAIYNEVMTRPQVGADRVYSEREWIDYLITRGKDMILKHAFVLDATGASAEALELMEEIKGKYNFKSAEYNNQYVHLLEKNGYQSMVIPTIVASVREDAVTPEMLEILRKDYVKQHKNDKDFEAYVSSLKSQEKQQELQKHLQETMINKDIELFAMEDLDGKKVGSSSCGTLQVTPNADLQAGTAPSYSDRYMRGNIQDLSLWKDVRTAEEVAADINCDFSGTEDGLNAYWPLNLNLGTSITDKTGNHTVYLVDVVWENPDE